MNGNLVIKPISAKLTHNTESVGSMDPYVIVEYNDQKCKSSVAKSAGKYPNWSDTFTFRVSGNNNLIKVVVWDKDSMSADDMVGEGHLIIKDNKGKDT